MKTFKKTSLFYALLLISTAFNTHKTHTMEPEDVKSSSNDIELIGNILLGSTELNPGEQIMFSFTNLPPEDASKIASLLFTYNRTNSLKSCGKIINSLAQVNHELNELINNPDFCLQLIKHLAQQCKCSDQEAAEALQTQEAKKRLGIQKKFLHICKQENFNQQTFADLYEKYKEYVDLNFIYIIDSNKFTTTLLILAASKDNCHLIQILLNCGANINKTSSSGTTALMVAVIYGHVNTVLCLLNNPKIAINQQSSSGETALLLAAKMDREHILQILLKHGAKINKADQTGKTALMIAADNNYIDIVQHLLKNPDIAIDQQNNLGQTALMLAIGRKNKQIIQLLLAAGADPEIANNKGITPLQVAQTENNQAIIDLIQDAIEKKYKR